MNRLPPISALRAFDAASRHLSFTKAANELHITQSAISHQIKCLEDLWNVKLFVRLTRRLVLTPPGEALSPIFRDFAVRLEDTLRLLEDSATTHSRLRVWVFPSFALKWLVPRLQGFHKRYPNIDVWIAPHSSRETGFQFGQLDASFCLGESNNPSFDSRLLMREYMYPVARPEFLRKHGIPITPADLCRYLLLLRTGDDGAAQWESWFAQAGVPEKEFLPALRAGTRFADSATTLQAALEGQGVALARSATVWDDLKAGRLLRLFNVTCRFHHAIYFTCPKDRAELPALVAFRDWILAESAKSQSQFEADEVLNSARLNRSSKRLSTIHRVRHRMLVKKRAPVVKSSAGKASLT